ncbi:MAG: VWA domain-containing protein, partial [Pseudomonadota bacterium]
GERTPADWVCRSLAVAHLAAREIGGIVLCGGPGEGRSACLQVLRDAQPDAAPWRTVPANIDVDRLLGGLDLSATLSAGKPMHTAGLLTQANDGWLQLNMAERQAPWVISSVNQALDNGTVTIARDGIEAIAPARFSVVALDEARPDEDGVLVTLRERLALTIHCDLIRPVDVVDAINEDAVSSATDWRMLTLSTAQTRQLATTAAALGDDGARTLLALSRVARIVAALDATDTVQDIHLAEATVLVIAMRVANGVVAPPPDEAQSEVEQPPPLPPDQPRDNSEHDESETLNEGQAADQLDDAIAACLPTDLLARMTRSTRRSSSRAQSAGAGAEQSGNQRGRPLPSRRGRPSGGKRIDLLATLKAAAPMQSLRVKRPGQRLRVVNDDLRVRRFREPSRTTTLFVVDASGSAAMQRLAETKGAIELLLAECYVRRDQVGLIAFRDHGAELALPPTRSLVRAKRTLAAMVGGGPTPLANGLQLALASADGIVRRGEEVLLVILSDARANITLSGEPLPERAAEDALSVAREISARGLNSLVIDTARRPGRRCQQLADALAARYVPLPFADARAVSSVVSELVA